MHLTRVVCLALPVLVSAGTIADFLTSVTSGRNRPNDHTFDKRAGAIESLIASLTSGRGRPNEHTFDKRAGTIEDLLTSLTSGRTRPNDHTFDKRVSVTWGPIFYLGPSEANIISAVTTSYPGKMPQNQKGGLYLWPGMGGSGNGEYLVQSVMGSYPEGQSECGADDAQTDWCISAEMYGPSVEDPSTQMQYVGDTRTIDTSPEGGLVFNYTLTDAETFTWKQTVHGAATGVLMAEYESQVNSDMKTWNVAVECQDCSPTIDTQTYQDTTIVLDKADPNFGATLYMTEGATGSEVSTPDGGKTWEIKLITFAPMEV